MSNLLVVTQAEHAQIAGLDITALDEDAWVASVAQLLGGGVVEALRGRTTTLQVVTSLAVAEADRVIPGPTLIYHDQAGGWALLGDEAGQLHLLDVAVPPVGLSEPHLVLDRTLVRLLRFDPPPPVGPLDDPPSGGAITYDTLELRPWHIRRVIISTAFDAVDRTWHRGQHVEHVPQEPYHLTT